MGEIINMPPRGNLGSSQERELPDQRARPGLDAAEIEAEREKKHERARELTTKLEKNPTLSRADQLEVASGIWRVMERAQQKANVTKASIMRAAHIGSPTDSTKHLSQYAVNPAWPKERKEKARLNKGARKYVDLARATAEKAGWDVHDTILEVFGATSLSALGRPRVANPAFEELARALREVCEAIASKHQLSDYFGKLSRFGATLLCRHEAVDIERYFHWDFAGMEALSDSLRDHLCFSSSVDPTREERFEFGATSGDAFHDENGSVPPYPLVVLGQWSMGSTFPVRVYSSSWVDDIEGKERKRRAETEAQLEVEVRLCIIPYGKELTPRPAVRLKPILKIWPVNTVSGKVLAYPGEAPEETVVRFSRTKYDMESDEHASEWTSIDGKKSPCCLEFEPHHISAKYISYFERVRFLPGDCNFPRFFAVTGSFLEDWLGEGCDNAAWSPEEHQVHLLALGPPVVRFLGDSENAFSPLPTWSPAFAVEQSITGRHGPNLVDMLDERAGRLVALLEAALKDAAADREADYGKLRERIAAMRARPAGQSSLE